MKRIISTAAILILVVTTFIKGQTVFGWEVAQFPGGFPSNDSAILEESLEIFPNFPTIIGYENLHSLKVSITNNGTNYLFLKWIPPSNLVYPAGNNYSGSSFVVKKIINQGQYLDIKLLTFYNNHWYGTQSNSITNLYNGWYRQDALEWVSLSDNQPYPLDSIYVDTCYVLLSYNSDGIYYFDTWYYNTNYPELNLICGYGDVISSIELPDTPPNDYTLLQNYPNPFNPTTNISYQLKEGGFVNLKVFNSIGETVAELVNQRQEQGNYSIEFNASNLPS